MGAARSALGVCVTLGVAAAAAVWSGRPAPVAARAVAAPPAAPEWLSATGLYAADGRVDPRHLPFSPQYPLWSDGAVKSRWISLPEGAAIDVSDVDRWRFPAGTRLWKEFAWNGRKVETRMIWKPDSASWVFATYVWNEAQTDARRAPPEGVPHAVAVAAGKRHSIPGTGDCLACHGGAPAVVLGFNAWQLSDDRDPLAPHAEPLPPGAATNASLLAAHRLTPPRPELVTNPPRMAGEGAERAATGYLSANCGGCHNGTGPLARLGFDLLHRVAVEPGFEPAHGAVEAPTRYVVPGVPPDSARVVAAGAPERSALLHRMSSRRPSSQMPPLGTVLRDSVAVALVRQWIAALAPAAPALGARR